MEKPNNNIIEQHLKQAVEALTPNVLDQIDLATPQEPPVFTNIRDYSRLRHVALTAAACLCLLAGGGGAFGYQYVNNRVDTIIGIDVNPSVEFSINRKERILNAEPLNEDAKEILSEMNLKGVELNVGVNAVIGSMVTHGYLDDLDNAILVTVANDSVSKARQLRASVVSDIERTLEENQVQAVVYDQQVIEDDQIKTLAQEYAVSYGKAYFLKELIDQNQTLEMTDMERLSTMTMEEIAAEISDNALALGELADQVIETTPAAPEATTVPETTIPESSTELTTVETTLEESTTAPTTEVPTTVPPTTEEEVVDGEKVEIDYVDYEEGAVYVYFVDRIKWKNPTVSVRDQEGNTYAAYVGETNSDGCVIEVTGLAGDTEYVFVLGGLGMKGSDSYTTVKGYFETPVMAENAVIEDTEEETKKESEAESTSESVNEGQTQESEAPETEASTSETSAPEQTVEESHEEEEITISSEEKNSHNQETEAPETEPASLP